MAKVAAPKSANYDTRRAASQRVRDIKALRAKPVLTQPDRDALFTLLMDDFLARNPT